MDVDVLIVEDEIWIAEALKEFLSQYGLTAYICINGRQALEWLETGSPKVILSDVMMPIMNGLTFLDHVKKKPSLEKLPFFFMSSANLGEKDPRIDGFLKKPFEVDVMVKLLKSKI